MDIYELVVIITVLVSSVGLIILFRKRGIGGAANALTISLNSLIVCLLVPIIFNYVASIKDVFSRGMEFTIAISIIIFMYLILLVVSTILISTILSSKWYNNFIEKIKNFNNKSKNSIKLDNNNVDTEKSEEICDIIGEIEEKPSDFPLPDGRCEWLLRSGSEYFPINRPLSSMWCDSSDPDELYRISTRSNIKNYGNEIETFLEWIKYNKTRTIRISQLGFDFYLPCN